MQKLLNQAPKFSLDNSVVYLNGAFMSPQLKSVTEAGKMALRLKEDPSKINVSDFFERPGKIRESFSKLIHNSQPDQIAIIPSVSYGMANVAKNIDVKGKKIVIAGEQFPSNVYPWMQLAKEQGGKLDIINPPDIDQNRGKEWNNRILEAIDSNTALLAISQVHWADGTKFSLKELRQRTRDVGARMVIDGTQSVGAMPFDINELEPDALICAGYKWLLGPYGLGVAYYSAEFNEGAPIEENWINRLNSEDIAGLVDFEEMYQAGAQRYSMGEQSQFVLAPMFQEALTQINQGHPLRIQEYCADLVNEPLKMLREKGFQIEDPLYRANHLFGIRHESLTINQIKESFSEKGIFVSYRGSSVRVSPYVHNTADQIDFLSKVLLDLL